MSFLAPLFLLGGLAIVGPVLFHLIRRNTREKFTFSSLMFLRADPPKVTRKSRLEDILLLLVRCALLAVMALAFSRPFMRNTVTAGHDATIGQRIVLLIDTSASMQRAGIWEKTLTEARTALAEVQPSDSFSILTFNGQTQPLLRFDQWRDLPEPSRLPAAREALNGLQPGWGSTHLGNAILTAAELLEENPHTGPQQIIVLTDRQEGAQLDGLQGHDWPTGLQLTLKTVASTAVGNAGIHLAPGHATEDTDSTSQRVRVTNSDDAAREQFQLAWRQGDTTHTNTVPVYVPAGQSRTLTAPRRPAGPNWQLALLGDSETFDNTLHIAPLTPEPVRIHYLGRESAEDTEAMRFYLERAFSTTRLQHVEVLTHLPSALEGKLAHPDDRLLIIGEPIEAAHVDRVRQFAESGHSVLLPLKSDAMAGTLTALAKSGPIPLSEASVEKYALLSQVDFEHPLLAPFNEPRFSDFTKIHFWKHRTLDPARLPGARVLARFDDGDPALLDLPLGHGHLFVLTSGWHPADSQLALASKFVPLLYSMLELGQTGGRLKTAHFVGQPVTLPGESDTARTVTGPGPDAQIPAGQSGFHADQPGLFTLQGSRPVTFAVNVPARESRTEPLAPERLDGLNLPFAPGSVEKAEIEQNREQTLIDEQLEKRQKIWRWLIVAAIMLVLLETWLGGWLWRKPAAAAESPGEAT